MNENHAWVYAVYNVREQSVRSVSATWSYDNKPVQDGNFAEIFVNYFPI